MRGALLSLSLYEPSESPPEERKHCCYSSYIGKWWNCFCEKHKDHCPVEEDLCKHARHCNLGRIKAYRKNYLSLKHVLLNMKKEYHYVNIHSDRFSDGKWHTLSKNRRVKQYKYPFHCLSDEIINKIIRML